MRALLSGRRACGVSVRVEQSAQRFRPALTGIQPAYLSHRCVQVLDVMLAKVDGVQVANPRLDVKAADRFVFPARAVLECHLSVEPAIEVDGNGERAIDIYVRAGADAKQDLGELRFGLIFGVERPEHRLTTLAGQARRCVIPHPPTSVVLLLESGAFSVEVLAGLGVSAAAALVYGALHFLVPFVRR
jgi:hypothetical protein